MPQWSRVLFALCSKDTQPTAQEEHTHARTWSHASYLQLITPRVINNSGGTCDTLMNTEVPGKKPHAQPHTRSHYTTHTEKRSHKSRYDLSSVAQLFFVLLSNVVRADIHHLDDILMSHPRAVSISPPLSLTFFPFPPTRRPSLHK